MACVRPAVAADRDQWIAMWDDFVAAKPGEAGERGLGEVNWARCMEATCPLECLVAVDADGRLAGFVLHSLVCWTWSRLPVCYLLDIYVRPDRRGAGHGRRLLVHLADIGRAAGWYKIFWMTEHDNLAAQSLYRSVARQTDYIRFDLPLAGK